jgi:DNA ligase 1
MRERTGIMLATKYDEKYFKRFKSWYVQPKLNGERFRAVIEGDKVKLLSSTAREITSVPHINYDLRNLADVLPSEFRNSCVLDGELYKHRMDFNTIQSIVSRKVNPHPDYYKIEAHIFDIITPDMQWERVDILYELLPAKLGALYRVETIRDIDLTLALKLFVEDDYEGIIVRNAHAFYEAKRSMNLLKIKPMLTNSFIIIGTEEEISNHGDHKNSLGALICSCNGKTFNVGTGFTKEDRKYYWENRQALIGKWCKVKYQTLSETRKVPLIPVFLKVF